MTTTELARAKLDMHFEEAGISKDKSGPESLVRAGVAEHKDNPTKDPKEPADQDIHKYRSPFTKPKRPTLKRKRLQESFFTMDPKKKIQTAPEQRTHRNDSPKSPLARPEQETEPAPQEKVKEAWDSWERLNTPYKRAKPTPFTTRITRFKYHEKAKLLRNVKVYKGSKDPKDHLGIFSVAVEQEE
ncbi:hypothetical protein Tco_0475086 [Tanacetum coccineum]